MHNTLHPTIAAALNPFIPQSRQGMSRVELARRPIVKNLIDFDSFNDDDVYVYCATSFEFVKQYPSCLADVQDARAMGFKVNAGNTWAKGMRAKYLGLWSAT